MSIQNLTKVFTSGILNGRDIVAVKDVSFDIPPGVIISLIGESGSGKTTIGKLILRLLKPTSGKIFYKGRDITAITSRKEVKEYYKKVQAIFQDPFSSFNPLFRVDRVFDMVFDEFLPEETDRLRKIEAVLENVNLEPREVLHKFPHQLSGGQLQRLLIARALLLKVDILVADELISMLDASTRIGILNLLADLSRKNGMSVLFITHDLSLGYYISDYTLIMYKGRLVEKGITEKIYKNPVHPYTKMLFASVPDIGRKWDKNEEFVPEQVAKAIDEFYGRHKGHGFAEVEEEHEVFFG